MKRTAIPLALAALLLLVLGLIERPSFVALAQSGGLYDLIWSAIGGGGATLSTGGGYSLSSTVGQPGAGLLTGGDYTLGGGLWCGGALAVQYDTYLPLVLKN